MGTDDLRGGGGARSAVDVANRLGEGLTVEERKKKLAEALDASQGEYERRLIEVARKKTEIEDVRLKYENLSDMVTRMDQLKASLEEHMKTVRLSEGSFAGTAAVLEYDTAKQRSRQLVQVIEARVQWERAREALTEEGMDGEDRHKTLAHLVDMHNSKQILSAYMQGRTDEFKQLEQLKDQFLAWQSTALVFAIHKADMQQLQSIQQTYASLDRADEFIGIFSKVCSARISEHALDTSSVDGLIDGLYKELECVFSQQLPVLARLEAAEGEASRLLSSAAEEGLSRLDLAGPMAALIGESDKPLEIVTAVDRTLSSRASSASPQLGALAGQLRDRVLEAMISPVRGSLTSHVLARLNTLELTGGSHRTRVESGRAAVADLLALLHDCVLHCAELFGDKAKQVCQQPIDKGLDNLMAKLKAWHYDKDSQGRSRNVDDLAAVCAIGGQLTYALEHFRSLTEGVSKELAPSMKPANKWNQQAAERMLKAASEGIVEKMCAGMRDVRSLDSGAVLPSWGMAPSEYATSAAQELLHCLHRLEQLLLDQHTAHSLYAAFRRRVPMGEELLNRTLSEVADSVVSAFVAQLVDGLSPAAAAQLHTDAAFLKEALDDLRAGDVSPLETAVEKLAKQAGIEKK